MRAFAITMLAVVAAGPAAAATLGYTIANHVCAAAKHSLEMTTAELAEFNAGPVTGSYGGSNETFGFSHTSSSTSSGGACTIRVSLGMTVVSCKVHPVDLSGRTLTMSAAYGNCP
ncbi:hypothetical protein EDC65_1535 [Stella humosa]|uniref:Secreted protein n=1 Tax=Stella humosa TaxID=94 RepID=A0A3N1M944_9PROT|nr:hypothetical protein [Stella humosa]ROP99748.1 hypothetical protein EDC65_1535 [Stella humosa]BBK31025.1 hypothetical protein STHU_16590 [Stella humosa]